MIDSEKRDLGKWWVWILGLVLFSIIALSVLRYVGILGQTIIEREVFEQSYQKQAGDNQRNKAYRAQLAEINSRLLNPNLDVDLRNQLESQKAMLNIQINSY